MEHLVCSFWIAMFWPPYPSPEIGTLHLQELAHFRYGDNCVVMVIGMNSSKALGPENAHLLGEFLKLHFLSYKSSDSEMFDM